MLGQDIVSPVCCISALNTSGAGKWAFRPKLRSMQHACVGAPVLYGERVRVVRFLALRAQLLLLLPNVFW